MPSGEGGNHPIFCRFIGFNVSSRHKAQLMPQRHLETGPVMVGCEGSMPIRHGGMDAKNGATSSRRSFPPMTTEPAGRSVHPMHLKYVLGDVEIIETFRANLLHVRLSRSPSCNFDSPPHQVRCGK